MSVTIYHTPACGTAGNTLAMIRRSGEELVVIDYLSARPSRDKLVARFVKQDGEVVAYRRT